MKAFLLLLVCSVAHAGTVKFQVPLSPAGDFVAQSAKGRGFLEKMAAISPPRYFPGIRHTEN
jgi:hypothetical protein